MSGRQAAISRREIRRAFGSQAIDILAQLNTAVQEVASKNEATRQILTDVRGDIADVDKSLSRRIAALEEPGTFVSRLRWLFTGK